MNWLAVKNVIEWLTQIGVIGFLIWLFQYRIQKRQDERDAAEAEKRKQRQEEIDRRNKERDELEEKRHKESEEKELRREQYEVYLMKCVNASMDLSEATAKAVQRIPDAHCNGDMHAALDYCTKVKQERNDFITKETVNSIYGDDNT